MATPSPTQASRKHTTRWKPALSNSALRVLISLLVGASCFIAASSQSIAAETSVSKEYQIKAAFVYNFTKFVEWSSAGFGDHSSPFVIGVFAKSRYTRELEVATKGRKINNRSIVVQEVKVIEEARRVHMLVFDAASDTQIREMLAALKDVPVLTIGESEQFVESDGIINFVLEGDKVRFEINVAAAEQAGLKVSSQLLKLAKTVRKEKQE